MKSEYNLTITLNTIKHQCQNLNDIQKHLNCQKHFLTDLNLWRVKKKIEVEKRE